MTRGGVVARDPGGGAVVTGVAGGRSAAQLREASEHAAAAAAATAGAIPEGWSGRGAVAYRGACELLVLRATGLVTAADAAAAMAAAHEQELRAIGEVLAAGGMVPV